MESNAIYTTSDAGLNRFFGKIYGLVGMGVGLSAVISYLMLGPFSHLFVNILMNYSWEINCKITAYSTRNNDYCSYCCYYSR